LHVRLGTSLRYGSHSLLAVILVVGAAAAWQMLQALDSKTDALTRHLRVDVWTTQEAELATYQLRHALARHVAGDEATALASIKHDLTRLRQAIALLTVKDRGKELDAIPGGEELVLGFGNALDRLEALLAGQAAFRGDVGLLLRADDILMPWLDRLRRLASSLTHVRLELQDRDSAKVGELIGLNRWLLLTVVGAACLFIGLLATELRIARRAESLARADRRRFQDFAEIASDWLFETDASLDLRFLSEQVEAATGLPASHYVGAPAHRLLADPAVTERDSPVVQAMRDRRPFRDLTISLNGNQLFLRLSAKPVLSEAGRFLGYRGIGTDISSEVKRKERIRFLAERDALTGLYNRSFFQDELRHVLSQAGDAGERVSLLILDLDKFKDINDSFGHDVGDALIVQAAERLSSCLRGTDLLARLGGDEFAIVQREEASDPATTDKLTDRLLAAINAPMRVEGFEFVVGTSIGFARFPADGAHVEDLMKAADLALYGAKAKGRNRASAYRQEMSEELKQKRRLETDLRQALENDALDLHVQPQVDLETERLTGGEALVRWRHPELGPIRPDVFIPIAEETGLILPLGRWVMETACRAAKRHLDDFGDGIIAVNVSPAQFTHQDLVKEVAGVLKRTGLPAANLELEITEGLLMRDHQLAVRTLDRLHAMGVKLAIDDFGTGYSSLSYLKRFRVHKLKIDKAFVGDLEHDQDDGAIVQAVIMMSKALGFETLAEGVETAEQRQRLLALGCGQAQGYYYGKPCPIDDFFRSYGIERRLRDDAAPAMKALSA
jgi:diguanylate cyclase (GGDEF)-like protein